MSQNHYQVLGVAVTATAHEIKLAYKRLAVRYHPDKHGGSTQFEEQFKQVSVAYQVLGDPARRAVYDYQLQVVARRAEEARRQQQFRQQGQHVYGVPMPPPVPLRTRPPAGAAERHYRTIPKQKPKFNRRDYLLTFGVFGLLILFMLSVKVTMDHVTAVSNYEDGLAAYVNSSWGTAHGFFTEALHFKPTYTEALQRRGEIEQFAYQNYRAARTDYRAALANARGRTAAQLWYRLGQCHSNLNQPDSAEICLGHALALDSLLSGARLARGETRLFGLNAFEAAIQDFSAGLRLRKQQGRSLKYLTYRGLAYYKLGNYAAARSDYQQVLLQNPRNGQAYFLLGRLAQREENAGAACEFFRRAVTLGYSYAAAAQQQTCP
ncbi:J domain-containing protein [Hymenobacter sp. GOD-10R]|uniref:J domain-containing protein n=1 Tax=Hymenobacter sp. GOD-10R TaxID=3093922 RepID=UPI002D791C50|nr:DnaJ domain-containing protein [Hymenobacter sp. GOD-10R]WRQ28483.1 DnaJ domain-containing protein [Hymenobacter sp. GOD-10R]